MDLAVLLNYYWHPIWGPEAQGAATNHWHANGAVRTAVALTACRPAGRLIDEMTGIEPARASQPLGI